VRGNIINKHREYLANEVNLDQEFSLSLGQSIMIAGESLVIKFIATQLTTMQTDLNVINKDLSTIQQTQESITNK
jgi:hypothetical protein